MVKKVNPAKFRFPFFDQDAKVISVKINSSPTVSEELTTLFQYCGVRAPLHDSQNQTGDTDVFPLLIMSKGLASSYSRYWSICGLKKNPMNFSIDGFNPHATTPPQSTRSIPISHDVQGARRKQLYRCVALVDAVKWISSLS